MVKINKHNKNDASLRGGAKVSDMKKKNADYYKKARGRPYRYAKLLAEAAAAELAEMEDLKKEVAEKAKVKPKKSKVKKSGKDADKK